MEGNAKETGIDVEVEVERGTGLEPATICLEVRICTLPAVPGQWAPYRKLWCPIDFTSLPSKLGTQWAKPWHRKARLSWAVFKF